MHEINYNPKKFKVNYGKKFTLESMLQSGITLYTFGKKEYVYVGNGKCYCERLKEERSVVELFNEVKLVRQMGLPIAKRKSPEKNLLMIKFERKIRKKY